MAFALFRLFGVAGLDAAIPDRRKRIGVVVLSLWLRGAWVNLDLIWGMALIVAAGVALLVRVS